LKNSNQFCKLKRIDTNIEDLPTFENRFQLSTEINKDEQLVSSSSSSSSSFITKGKRIKAIEPMKSQLSIKISTRQQPSIRSNRKTLAFKSKKVIKKMKISHRNFLFFF
jgi:adenylate cyclase class IV